MIRYDSLPGGAPPPSFLAAKNRRQKARAAGLSPDYWYPVARSEKLLRGKVVGTRFWGQPIAVYRDAQGQAHALEDRCAHRQLKLSLGQVKDCKLVCSYHGWEYSSDGKLASIPHELHGKPFPDLKVGTFAVQERYGLVWIFPGNPALASTRHLPEIPELQGSKRWGRIAIDGAWKTHHSMVIENVSDLSRAYPRRKSMPFWDAKLTRCEALGERVRVRYDLQRGVGGNIFRRFIDLSKVNGDHVDLCYEYPYQWSSTDDKIKTYCFVLPMDPHMTHSFFLFCFKSLRIPFLPLLRLLLGEDRTACEAELEGYLHNYEAPIAEFNPAVGLFQQLTIRKWEEYLATRNVTNAGVPPEAAI